MSKIIKINNIQYHRNGVCGEPFHVINFNEGRCNMTAVVFAEYNGEKYISYNNPRVSVFNTRLLGKRNINFGENSFRGDRYSNALINAINRNEEKTMEEYRNSVDKHTVELFKQLEGV
tara:strand:- start:37 stop:390 length:354 start_codon:yes stop_codon:yes gene_type:complete